MDNDLLAKVFTNKGCSKVIGWSGAVSMEETDKTTLQIVNTIVSGENINDLIEEVNYGKDKDLKLVMIERSGG